MRLLVIEDDISLLDLLVTAFTQAGFSVDATGELAEGLELVRAHSYDGVVLDRGLPDGDGLDLLKRIRAQENEVPVLVLTARDSVNDRVTGLNDGADDYLGKPFETVELIARVQSLLRRSGAVLGEMLEEGNISLNSSRNEVHVDGKIVDLTTRERQLLEQLMRRAGKIASRQDLETAIFQGSVDSGSTTIDVMIHRLRKKLLSFNASVEIQTFRGVGYMLTERNTKYVVERTDPEMFRNSINRKR